MTTARGTDAVAESLRRGVDRLRERWPLLAQIGVAVLLSWFLARSVLHHEQPFFAPVTAILGLGLTYGQRLRRIAEVAVGVAIGVLVGDVIVILLGSGAWQMALVVMAAMSIAVVLSSGQLVVIQSGVQAVFIVAFVATTGEGVSRWVDALVGGGVAIVIGTLAPTGPLARPRARAARTLREVAAVLRAVATALRARDAGLAAAALEEARSLEGSLTALRLAAAEGVAVVRQSPLLRRHRPRAAAAAELVVPLDRCVRNLRVLARRASVALRRDEPVPHRYAGLLTELADATDDLARALDENDAADVGSDRPRAGGALLRPGRARREPVRGDGARSGPLDARGPARRRRGRRRRGRVAGPGVAPTVTPGARIRR